ncbi:MAG: DNA (cytosine-5-)-methyltransferase [Marinifilaceae bacterium]
MENNIIRFIDLFAGIGGIRCGLELAAIEAGYKSECVFTSEIKKHAIRVLNQNYPDEIVYGDITTISEDDIPDFDILCAGFPCQAFSSAGKRLGFSDTRGTLFFEVERILKAKKPKGFILENVEGLVNHEKGNTLATIIAHLERIGYKVSYKILNSKEFGIPQERKRIYIVGTLNKSVSLNNFPIVRSLVKDILESGLPTSDTIFIRQLLSIYDIKELYGKSIKDKRGGDSNIHSWDIELKGPLLKEQKDFLNQLMKERRKKKWALEHGIDWMDGMPLTFKQIQTFYNNDNLNYFLQDMVDKGYLKYEYPKKLVRKTTERGISSYREYDITKEKGYNIVAGKLSFEINKILDPNDIAPTLVAMDMQKIYVEDNGNLRKLSLREGLRLFGYPESYSFNVTEKEGYDLLGNTVVVPVIKAIAKRLINIIKE